MPTAIPIPAQMRDQPVQGGLAIPWNALKLPDGGWDLAGAHSRKTNLATLDGRCQGCGFKIARPFHFFAGHTELVQEPLQLQDAPLHRECADYAAAACPMLNGRLTHYRSKTMRAHRIGQCATPGCNCGGWTTDDNFGERLGAPAPQWWRLICRSYNRGVTHKMLETNLRLGMSMPGEKVLAMPVDILSREPVPAIG